MSLGEGEGKVGRAAMSSPTRMQSHSIQTRMADQVSWEQQGSTKSSVITRQIHSDKPGPKLSQEVQSSPQWQDRQPWHRLTLQQDETRIKLWSLNAVPEPKESGPNETYLDCLLSLSCLRRSLIPSFTAAPCQSWPWAQTDKRLQSLLVHSRPWHLLYEHIKPNKRLTNYIILHQTRILKHKLPYGDINVGLHERNQRLHTALLPCRTSGRILSFEFGKWPHCTLTQKGLGLRRLCDHLEAFWLLCLSRSLRTSARKMLISWLNLALNQQNSVRQVTILLT